MQQQRPSMTNTKKIAHIVSAYALLWLVTATIFLEDDVAMLAFMFS